MPRNPSELQRLEEEREDLINCLRNGDMDIVRIAATEYGFADKGYKAQKQGLLNQLREIERQLGIEHVPYNSSKFGEQLK